MVEQRRQWRRGVGGGGGGAGGCQVGGASTLAAACRQWRSLVRVVVACWGAIGLASLLVVAHWQGGIVRMAVAH